MKHLFCYHLLLLIQFMFNKMYLSFAPNDVEKVGTEVVTTFAMQSKKVCDLYA